MLPEKYKDFRKITFVRHPLDWYSSRFFFDKNKFKKDEMKLEPFSDALSLLYESSFEETVKRMLDLTEAFSDEIVLNLFKKRVRKEVTNNYQCWWVSYFDDIENLTADDFQHLSLYQWFIKKLGVERADAVYRLEDQYGFGMKKEFGEDVGLSHRNKTPNKPTNVYSDELEKMVLEKEKEFIRKYYD
jgi:hypothetical protein